MFIQINKNNINDLTSLHRKAFPGFFLTNLGEKVLNIFYLALIEDKSTISWGVREGERLVGFFVASTNSKGLYLRIFIKKFHKFILPLLSLFLSKPLYFFKMYISYCSTKDKSLPINCSVSLLSICVHPNESGKGIGKLLIHQLEFLLKKLHFNEYYLTTDSDNNFSTNNFYLKNCFQIHSTYWQRNRKMNIYIKKIL